MSTNQYSGLNSVQIAALKASTASATHTDTDVVVDKDARFVIDAKTRVITNNSGKKDIAKGDHNSERFAFECERYIEGHDMLLCNVVKIHYMNVNTSGVWDVIDMSADPEDENKIVFTWLVSANATSTVGKLRFSARFQCVQEDGTVTYSWGTKINEEISIVDNLDNSSSSGTGGDSGSGSGGTALTFNVTDDGNGNVTITTT